MTVLSEWLQESQDFQLAQELAKALEQEHDCQKRLEMIQGEAEALRVAVEEKRRIKSEAQAKTDQELADEEFARKLAADEVKYFESKKQQFEDDEKYCHELQAQERQLYGESKAESKDDLTDCSSIADSKGGGDEKQVLREEKSSRSLKESKDDDSVLESPRTSRRALRSKLQRQLFDDLPENHPYKKHNFNFTKDEALVSKIWEKGSAEITELKEALCITLQLPNIQRLHVGLDKEGKMMKINAKRYVRKNSTASPTSSISQLFTTDSTQYNAEFVLDGDVAVTTRDIYHEYYQEYGVLFIYVENICLDCETSQKTVLGKGRQALSKFKNNLLRIFGAK